MYNTCTEKAEPVPLFRESTRKRNFYPSRRAEVFEIEIKKLGRRIKKKKPAYYTRRRDEPVGYEASLCDENTGRKEKRKVKIRVV